MHEQLTEHSLIQLKEHIRLYVGKKILFIMLPENNCFWGKYKMIWTVSVTW